MRLISVAVVLIVSTGAGCDSISQLVSFITPGSPSVSIPVTEYCSACGSSRTDNSGQWQSIIKDQSCIHQWEEGMGFGLSNPVGNNVVVLVSQGEARGAFVFSQQLNTPEKCRFSWWCREDGKGVFDSKDAVVVSGIGTADVDRPISFGPFIIGWSGHDGKSGWLYYSQFAGTPRTTDSLNICVTSESGISHINSNDSKWVYKCSRSDKGITFSDPDISGEE